MKCGRKTVMGLIGLVGYIYISFSQLQLLKEKRKSCTALRSAVSSDMGLCDFYFYFFKSQREEGRLGSVFQ